jgi:hypothetical protein
VLHLKPPDPGVDCRPRHVEKATDTDLLPPVIVELDDLQPCLIAVRLGMIVPQPQVPLVRGAACLPDRLHRLVVDRGAELDEQNPCEFAIVEPVIQDLESIDLLPHGLRDGTRPPPVHHLDVGGEEARHALPLEAPLEGTDGVRMGGGFVCALPGCPIGKQDQRADELITLLCLIDEAQLQLPKFRGWFPRRPSYPSCG